MFTRQKYDYDLIVLGSGSGGSVGAFYAASLGKKVAVVESDTIGGEGSNAASIPAKSFIHAARTYASVKNATNYGITIDQASLDFSRLTDWKDLAVLRTNAAYGKASYQKAGIHVFHAKARFLSPHMVECGGKVFTAAKFLIATGSHVVIPQIPGLDEAGHITFKHAFQNKTLPQSILIYGGGAVGVEFAYIYASLGAKVYLVTRSARLLSNEDIEVSELVKDILEHTGVTIVNGIVQKVDMVNEKKQIHISTKHGEAAAYDVDELFIATGKAPNINFSPEKAKITFQHDRLPVDKYYRPT